MIHDNGMHAAIAIKPNTSVDSVIPFLDSVEMVLVMVKSFSSSLTKK